MTIQLGKAAAGYYRLKAVLPRSMVGRDIGYALRTLRKNPGFTVTALGVAIGVAASFGLTRLLANFVFGVKTSDPLVFVAVPILLIVVAVCAALAPAMRATRIDPVQALRAE